MYADDVMKLINRIGILHPSHHLPTSPAVHLPIRQNFDVTFLRVRYRRDPPRRNQASEKLEEDADGVFRRRGESPSRNRGDSIRDREGGNVSGPERYL